MLQKTELKVHVNQLMMTLLVLMMLLRGLYFVPGIVTTCIWLAFIMTIFAGTVKGTLSIKLTPFNRLIYLYCFLLVISEMTGGYFALNTLLSYAQFALFTALIVNFSGENIEDGLNMYFRYLKPLVYLSIGFSLVLKTFGSTTWQGTHRINYLFTPAIRQYSMGMQGQQLGYSGFYTNPNVFGFYCLVVLIVLLNDNGKIKPAKKFLGFLWLLVGIWLADSRAVIICSLIVILLYILSIVRKKISQGQFMALIAAGVVGVLLILIVFWDVIILYIGGINLEGRSEMWQIMLKSISEHPVFGIGFANSTKYLLGDLSTGSTVGSHNSYLNILCENGILGFAVFLAMNVYLLLIIYRNRNAVREDMLARIGAVVFMVYIPYAFVENAYMLVEGRSYLWLLICAYLEYMIRKSMLKSENDGENLRGWRE